jgi:hypothetical protein
MGRLQRRRDRVLDALRSAGYDVHTPEATFYPDAACPVDDDLAFAKRLAREKVLITPRPRVRDAGLVHISLTGTDDMFDRALPVLERAAARAETVETEETSRPSLGYLVVLLGVAGWVVSCFRPLYRITEAQTVRTTLVRQVSFGSVGTRLGGILYLFGGITAIVVFALVGVRVRQRWNVAVLAGAVVAWSLASIGVLITIGAAASGFSIGSVLGVGYWGLWVSVICVVAGTVILVVSLRPRGRRRRGGSAGADRRGASLGPPRDAQQVHLTVQGITIRP